MLLDNAPTHPSALELNSIDENCLVVYLPPNVTSLIQPMDQGVISALKRHYKMGFLRESLTCNHNSNCEFIQFVKKWTVLNCMNVLKESWISLTPNTLRNSWKKLINTVSIIFVYLSFEQKGKVEIKTFLMSILLRGGTGKISTDLNFCCFWVINSFSYNFDY